VLNLPFTSLLKGNALWLGACENASCMHCLCELGGKVLPGDSAGFERVVATVRSSLGGALGCNVGDFDEKFDEVKNVGLVVG
jgi:hypothetical protein